MNSPNGLNFRGINRKARNLLKRLLMLSIIFSSFILVLLAELGDKTNLYAFNIGLHASKKIALLAISFSIFFVMALGALLGQSLHHFFNLKFIQYTIASLFFLVGILFLFNKDLVKSHFTSSKSFWSIFTGFSLAEMGDKSQLVVFALSAKYKNFFAVWAGASLAELTVNIFSLWFGQFLQKKIKLNFAFISGILFLLFSCFSFYEIIQEVVRG